MTLFLKNAIISGVVLPWVTFLYAQAPDTLWTKTYGGPLYDFARSVQETPDSGFIIAGSTNSFGAGMADIYLMKIDSEGDTIWTRTYGGVEADVGYSVSVTFDNKYILVGYTHSFGVYTPTYPNVYLIKVDTNGDTLWTRTYGGQSIDRGESIQETSDSCYIITGHTSPPDGSYDVYLIKINMDGDTIWTKKIGGTSVDEGYSVQQTVDGGYIVVGKTRSFGAGLDDVYLIKTDSFGDTIWTRTYGGINFDKGYSVQTTSDSGYIITGETKSFGAGSGDVYLIKTDKGGDTIWTRTYGGANWDRGRSLRQTSDGGYILTGFTESFGIGSWDVYLLKTDSFGDTIWTQTYGGTNVDNGIAVRQTSDGGYIIVGYTASFGSGFEDDVYIIKTEPDFGIEEKQIQNPLNRVFVLETFPNPFSDRLNVKYNIEHGAENREMRIYDIAGRLIKQFNHLTNQPFNKIIWNGRDNSGEKLPSGVYFLKFEASSYTATKKLLLIR